MGVRVIDTETALFRPGVMAPEMVCMSFAAPGEEAGLLHADDPRTKDLILSWLRGHDMFVGHHMPYDLAVICAKWPDLVPWVFAKLDRDEITDTKLRQQLFDIAQGEFRGYLKKWEKEVEVEECVCNKRFPRGTEESVILLHKASCEALEHKVVQLRLVKGARWFPHNYDLDSLIRRCSGRQLDKNTWRLRYGEFLNVPVDEWPEGAREYPKEDARATLEVFLEQEKDAEYIPDQFRQMRAAFALHLTSTWGLRTHAPGVDKLEQETREALVIIEKELRAAGLVRTSIKTSNGIPTKKDGTRDVGAARTLMVKACEEAHVPVRLTEKGQVSLDSDACEATDNELLKDYAAFTSLKTVLVKDIPVLRAGTVYPVHTSFGMAASGRSTSGNPNVQNPRRLPGIREAFIPRHGKVYAQADFSGLELHTLAQVCVSLFGHSHLAEVLNAGYDPHTAFAADILGITYEEADERSKNEEDHIFDNARQTAKVANFGFPGGLGFESLVMFARKTYKVILTEPGPDPFRRARELKVQWFERWPEMRTFFTYVGSLVGDGNDGQVKQLFSDRYRGGCHYTAACNTYFQGLGADAAKRALYLVTRACYAEPGSILYGSRPVNFVHDEVILEVDDDENAHDVAVELGRVMRLGADEFLPDVPSRIKPLLARCWSKKAKPTYDANKRLVPWAPKEAA